MARRFLRAGASLLGLVLAGTLLAGTSSPAADASPADEHRVTKKSPTAYGWGGAVASVDPEATAAGSGCCGTAATPSTPRWPQRPRSG